MKLDDTVRNWPVAPFRMSVSWTGNKAKPLERLEHDITLISGAKRLKLMIFSPHKCTSKYSLSLSNYCHLYLHKFTTPLPIPFKSEMYQKWSARQAITLHLSIVHTVIVDSAFSYFVHFFFHLCSVPLSDEKAQQIIDKALNSSSLDMRNVVGVITGLMGSGKTWLLSRLFNQLPPYLYSSTGVAERSLRSLLHHIINISLNCWEPFTYDQILEFLACLFHETLRESDVVPFASEGKAVSSLPTSAPSPLLPLPSSSSATEATSPPTAQSSSTTVPTSTAVTESSTMQSMVSKVKAPKSSSSQEILELVHMIDTGGQPEMLENLPSLIHHCHLIVLVLNLRFGLDEHPSIDYHEEGEPYKRALPSRFSNRQIMQKLASTLQAKRFYQQKAFQKEQTQAKHSSSLCFRLLVVATHRDCVPEGELEARIEAFDQTLRDVLLPANDKELIFFSANQIPFVLNLKEPNKEDQTRLDLIRSKISEGKVGEVVKTPGSFLVFEQVLAEFASKTVKRDIVSLKECQVIGVGLNMKPEEVEAALIFFNCQFTFLYFRHILPNLVFTKPQTPLECINAVVRFSYKVESGDVMGIPGKLVSSLRDGIITEEILSHEQLTQCFIPGLYEPCDAIDLLCHTLTLAPLSCEVQSTPDSSHKATSIPPPPIKREKREYLMMCLQKPISNKDLPQHLPPPSEIAPLVVQFTKNCVPLSCFSRTISCLLAMYDWRLSRGDKGSPHCLAHNVVSLYKPRTPGQVVLVDSGNSFQVHIRPGRGIDRNNMAKVCFQVKETLFTAIKQVFDILHLDGISASPAFFCPCERKSLSHFASPDLFNLKWHLYCSITEESVGPATDYHLLWLDTPATEAETPSLPKLLDLDIHKDVGPNYKIFGTFLLRDKTGMVVEGIRYCYRSPQDITLQILQEWLIGRGESITWQSLIKALRSSDLNVLADRVADNYIHK